MTEYARIILEVLRIGRTKEALTARAAWCEQRGKALVAKSLRFSGKRAARLARRGGAWADRSRALGERAAAL